MMNAMIHRLGELLKERGAKARLAEAIGKPASIISDICSGKDRLNDDLIGDIASALGVPVWHLFADPQDVIPPEYRALMEDYRKLDDDHKRIVDSMLVAARVAAEKKSSGAGALSKTGAQHGA